MMASSCDETRVRGLLPATDVMAAPASPTAPVTAAATPAAIAQEQRQNEGRTGPDSTRLTGRAEDAKGLLLDLLLLNNELLGLLDDGRAHDSSVGGGNGVGNGQDGLLRFSDRDNDGRVGSCSAFTRVSLIRIRACMTTELTLEDVVDVAMSIVLEGLVRVVLPGAVNDVLQRERVSLTLGRCCT